MKNFILTLLCLGLHFGIQAQDSSDLFLRKGRVLVETGYNTISGFSTGSGLNFLSSEGTTFTSVDVDGGYFIREDFAIKVKFSSLSGNGLLGSLTNFSVGGKYYIIGKIPVERTGGLSSLNNSRFLGNINVGYAINLVKNIKIEPNIGLLTFDDPVYEYGLTFSLFL